jgi:hypothetical protein
MVKLNHIQSAPSHHEYDSAKRTLRDRIDSPGTRENPRIDMRSILFQRRYANGSSLDRLSPINHYLVKIEVAVIAR